MNSVRSLSKLDINPVRNFLATCRQPFKASELYATADDSRFTDESIRVSFSRAIVDPSLTALGEQLVHDISASDPQYDYVLCPDNITHIKYLPGGFFSRHTDHCRGSSNMIEEFTLLINVNPPDVPCVGGATVIHAPASSSTTSPTTFDSTTTPGSGLLFRKDLEHEGTPVEEGEKHLLCLNVWGSRIKTGQVLLITCQLSIPASGSASTSASAPTASSSQGTPAPHVPSAGAIAPAAATASAETLRALSLDKTYALAAEDASASHVLKVVLEEANQHADEAGTTHPLIVRYEAPCDFDSFDVIFRVCSRMHVTTAMLEAQRATLDYFFPGANFKWENLLLEQAMDNGVDASAYPQVSASSLLVQSMAAQCAKPPADEDPDVIVTASAERTAVVAELARELDLPFVEFKFAFVKGDLDDSEGGGSGNIPLTQCWLSLGGYDSIFSMRRMYRQGFDGHANIGVEDLSLGKLLTHKDYFMKAHRMDGKTDIAFAPLDAAGKPGQTMKINFEEMDGDGWDGWEELGQAYCFGLKVAPSKSSIGALQMLSMVFESSSMALENLTYLPGGKFFDKASLARSSSSPWQELAVSESAVQKARVQVVLDGRKMEREKALAEKKAEAKAVWMQRSKAQAEEEPEEYGPFDEEAEAQMFEQNWQEEREDEEEAMFENGENRDEYGSVHYGDDPTFYEEEVGGCSVPPPPGAWLFHRDARGKTCFTEAEARAACELIAAMKLDERVAAAIEKTTFTFPQQHASPRAFVCNGEAYGEFELLEVTGVVRLAAKPDEVQKAKEEEYQERKAKFDKRLADEVAKKAKREAAAAELQEAERKKAKVDDNDETKENEAHTSS